MCKCTVYLNGQVYSVYCNFYSGIKCFRNSVQSKGGAHMSILMRTQLEGHTLSQVLAGRDIDLHGF